MSSFNEDITWKGQRKAISMPLSRALILTITLLVCGPSSQPSLWGQTSGTDWIGKAAPELARGEWINDDPMTLNDLRGKVVLIEFWTYGCYNCRNTLPHVKSWHKLFPPEQFRIIGVHTPEFQREKEIANLRKQVEQLGIDYAVVTDNDYKTWRSYNQRYWPVMYLLDKNGVIRNVRIGEGGYDEMEKMIGELIREESK